MSLVHAEDLCAAIRARWPEARVAPGQVTGEGDRAATVLCSPRDCPDCGTLVVAMRRVGSVPRWYQLGGCGPKGNGWWRVSYLHHNYERCQAALDGRGLVLPEVDGVSTLLARATEEPE